MRPAGLGLVVGCLTLAACGRLGFETVHDAATGADGIGPDTPASLITYEQSAGMLGNLISLVFVILPADVSVGDLIIVAFDWGGAASPSAISDTLGNTYQVIAQGTVPLGVALAYTVSTSAGPDSVSVTLTATTTTALEVHVLTYAGISPVAAFDASAYNSGSATGTDAASSGPIVAGSPNELLFGYFASTGTATSGTGFAQREQLSGDPTEDRLLTTPGVYAATATTGSTSWGIAGATFRGL